MTSRALALHAFAYAVLAAILVPSSTPLSWALFGLPFLTDAPIVFWLWHGVALGVVAFAVWRGLRASARRYGVGFAILAGVLAGVGGAILSAAGALAFQFVVYGPAPYHPDSLIKLNWGELFALTTAILAIPAMPLAALVGVLYRLFGQPALARRFGG